MEITTENIAEPIIKIAQKVPFNIAPERGEKLASDIFGDERWKISPDFGVANFSAVPQEKTLYLRYSGICSLWCVAKAAFHIMDISSKIQRENKATQSDMIDIGMQCAEMNLPGYIRYAKELFCINKPWPPELDMPDVNASLDTINGRVNNVFYGALSWIMLHEIAHVYNQDNISVPSSIRVKQEYRADDFATRWILEEAGAGLQREFRVLMIIVALAWLFIQESIRGQGQTHPPTILRFREASYHFGLLDRSIGLENAAYVLKALLDPQTEAPPFVTPKESFEWISNRLEQIYPIRR